MVKSGLPDTEGVVVDTDGTTDDIDVATGERTTGITGEVGIGAGGVVVACET